MQDYGGKKQKKDFTNMNNRILISLIVVLCFSCKKSNHVNENPIPDVPVNLTINLSLPTYNKLNDIGEFVYETGGVKGIIILHHTDDNFYALDRACSFNYQDSCALINADASNLNLKCGKQNGSTFINCCQSLFSFDGSVFQGPAKFGLKHYRISRSGNLLTIFN